MAELASPISGGIYSARGMMSSGGLRAAMEDRMVITNLIGGLNIRLDKITNDLADTTNVVERIRASIEQNSFLESQKEAIEQERERRLAEQQLREGQESLIERKIENAAVVPAQRQAIKAQSSLNSLMGLFTALLGGWLTVKVFSNFQNIQKFTLDKLGNTKEFIQGVFSNIGNLFKGINTSLSNLFLNVERVGNILKNSFNNDLFKGGFGLIKDLFEKAYSGLVNFDPSKLNPLNMFRDPNAGGGSPPGPGEMNRPGGSQEIQTSGFTTNLNLLSGGSTTVNNLFGGAEAFNMKPGSFMGESADKLNAEYGFKGAQDYGLGSMGSGYFTADMFKGLFDVSQMTGGSSQTNPSGPIALQVVSFNGSQAPAVARAETLGAPAEPQTNVVVSAAAAPQPKVIPPTLSRDGNNLPNISSSNPDNFYILYSMANYNVVI